VKRAEAIEVLADARGDDGLSVVTMRAIPNWYGIGAARERHLDNIGCMGAAPSLGLGLALAQPSRRVMVIDGDGSLLMQLGALASIADAAAPNFYHFVLVNGIYETSGQQPTPSAEQVDFAAIARGAGYPRAYTFDDPGVLRERLPAILDEPGPVLVALKVDPEPPGPMFPPGLPTDPAGALRAALVGPPASDAG